MTNTELAVLTLLAEKSNHGYEIEVLIEQRGMREWTEIGFSSIYYLLRKMAREGLVEFVPHSGVRGPAYKVYTLTIAGRRSWQAACLAALAKPGRTWSAFQLALSALPMLPWQDARCALEHYHDSQVARLQQIEERHQAQQPLPPHAEALFDFSLALLSAEISWLNEFLETMEREQENGKD